MFYMFFADGFEEVEAIAALDVIRRAKIDIKSVGIGGKNITGSHGITVVCDLLESEIAPSDSCDGIILPGGMPGTENLYNSDKVIEFVNYCKINGKFLCAICAAPIILGRKNYLSGKKAVCFPGFEEELKGASVSDSFVCRDGNIITAKGMGSAIEFGLQIAEELANPLEVKKIRASLQIYNG